jgi:hypothetical protein
MAIGNDVSVADAPAISIRIFDPHLDAGQDLPSLGSTAAPLWLLPADVGLIHLDGAGETFTPRAY